MATIRHLLPEEIYQSVLKQAFLNLCKKKRVINNVSVTYMAHCQHFSDECYDDAHLRVYKS